MEYLKLTNRTLGNCPDFRKSAGGIDWSKLECSTEDVSRLGIYGNDSNGDFISAIPVGNTENTYILAAIDDTNDNDYDEDSAEIIDQDTYETLAADLQSVKDSSTE